MTVENNSNYDQYFSFLEFSSTEFYKIKKKRRKIIQLSVTDTNILNGEKDKYLHVTRYIFNEDGSKNTTFILSQIKFNKTTYSNDCEVTREVAISNIFPYIIKDTDSQKNLNRNTPNSSYTIIE